MFQVVTTTLLLHQYLWLGSLFACPRSDLFSEQGLVEYKCWQKIDVMELIRVGNKVFLFLFTNTVHALARKVVHVFRTLPLFLSGLQCKVCWLLHVE